MRRRIMIVMLAVSTLALVGPACGDDSDDGDDDADVSSQDDGGGTTTTGGTSGTDTYDSPATSTTAGSSSSASGTVRVSDHPQLGRILVGPNGHTLYLFTRDTGTTSACTDACAGAWPALTSSGAPTAGTGVEAGKLSTASGQVAGHVVYNGHLLYYFAQDAAPGQTNGTSVANWFAVDPAGNQISR
jgi:predicted lipoprotein with Yx(FWY)xxD motif